MRVVRRPVVLSLAVAAPEPSRAVEPVTPVEDSQASPATPRTSTSALPASTRLEALKQSRKRDDLRRTRKGNG